jgi:hypothetical protein
MDIRLSPRLVDVNVLLICRPTIRRRHYRRRHLDRRQSPFPALAGNSCTRPPHLLHPWTSLSPFPDTTSSSPSTPATATSPSIAADLSPIALLANSTSAVDHGSHFRHQKLISLVSSLFVRPKHREHLSHTTVNPLSILYLHMQLMAPEGAGTGGAKAERGGSWGLGCPFSKGCCVGG